MQSEPFLKRVKIRNYKSIGHCDIALGRLTLLVGRNGSGKSNFLDALRLMADGLQTSLDHAIRARGGIDEVRRRSQGHPHNFSIAIEFNLSAYKTASYEFEIGPQHKGGFHVKQEALVITKPNGDQEASFKVHDGVVESSSEANLPPPSSDRLYLVTASGLSQYREAYDSLTAMGFYNLNPEQMKEMQSPDAGEILRRDGSNIASVVARLSEDRPELKDRIKEYLQAIVPDIEDFGRHSVGHRETLVFWQAVKGSKKPWKFFAQSMSDGTLRTLGILVATLQLSQTKNPVRLVGIEEPETALHPAASGGLMDSLREAAANTQVLVTTHSPDLLDQFDSDADSLLVVRSNQGETEIGPADAASIRAIKEHLFSPGEMLRMDQLKPDLTPQLTLFEPVGVDS